MNSLLKKLLAACQMEYLTLDQDLMIQEISSGVQRFADSPDDISLENDVRIGFPELIGMEDILMAIIQGEQPSFELKAVSRYLENNQLLYMDICIISNTVETLLEKKLVVVFADVTEKMMMEQTLVQRSNEATLLLNALAASKDYIEKIITSMADALLVTTRAGNIKKINQAAQKLFGYDEVELMGQSVSMIFAEDEILEQIFAQEFKLIQGEILPDMEVICQTKTGEKIPVAFSCSSIQTTTKDAQDLVYIGRDMTERRNAQEKIKKLNKDLEIRAIALEAANQELEAFSHSVAHDLRNPLNKIIGYNQIVIEEYNQQLDADGKSYLEVVKESSLRMNELITDLLRLSQVTRGEICYETVDLSALATAIAIDLQQRDPKRQVEFQILNGAITTGDAALLKIVLENLLGNAWKFTGKQPQAQIEFGISPQKNAKQTAIIPAFFVRDNGAGFDMKKASKLFTAFERLHKNSDFEGTGIGLATVQRIIHRHGGRIWAESSLGKGAIFYFTLEVH